MSANRVKFVRKHLFQVQLLTVAEIVNCKDVASSFDCRVSVCCVVVTDDDNADDVVVVLLSEFWLDISSLIELLVNDADFFESSLTTKKC